MKESLPIILKEVTLLSLIVRLFLAVLLGGLIGIERGRRRHAAGFRTHILVCVGSALAMITNQYIFENLTDGIGDPTRMGAQVISGIGFLGAGTIIVTGHQQIKGLTTAAGLWACASMGLAIGIGFYEGAILGFLFIIISVHFLHKLDSYFYRNTKVVSMYIELLDVTYFKALLSFIRKSGYDIQQSEFIKSKIADNTTVGIFITIKSNLSIPNAKTIADIQEVSGVFFVEQI